MVKKTLDRYKSSRDEEEEGDKEQFYKLLI